MERFDPDISSLQSALEQVPEAFQIVCVNIAIHVFDRMINDDVLVISFQTVVGQQLIGEDRRAGFYMLTKQSSRP
jgi:hypothetical protein